MAESLNESKTMAHLPALAAAVRFLTRVPAGERSGADASGGGGAAVPWYPLVGLGIGALLAGLAWLGAAVFPGAPVVTAVLVVAAWAAVTGALHLDGLADCADAWMAGGGSRRMLEVLRDTACGSAAIIAVVLALGLKVAAVAVLAESQALVLLVPPVAARMALVWSVVNLPYVRPAGLGAGLGGAVPVRTAVWVAGGCAIGVCLLSAAVFVAALAGVLAAFWVLQRSMIRHLGGCTGDVYGAQVELTECAVLAALVAVGI